MGITTTAYGLVTVDAETTEIGFAVTVELGHYSVRLTSYSALMMVYVDGTLDELAQFVADLAGVVRELSARELAATTS